MRRPTPIRLSGVAAGVVLVLSSCGTPVTDQAAPAIPPAAEQTDVATPSVAPPSAATPSDTTAPNPSESSSTPRARSKSSTPAPSTSSPTTPAPTPTESTTSTPTPSPSARPAALFSSGDSGEQGRELQHRLSQLHWYAGAITGRYAAATVDGVSGFQQKRSIEVTGEVDRRTWDTLVTMTKQPSHDQLHNVVRPGPALLELGSDGDRVRELQARLEQIDWHSGKITDHYGPATVANVKAFQSKRQLPVTGAVDQRTWDRLTAMTRTPTANEKNNVVPKPSVAGLDRRCLTGRALCISKSTNQLVWVIDAKPQVRVDVRFGSDELPTREGAFSVGWKSRDHVSTLYDTPMPFAMFFSGGQAVHYSPDFAARGYAGASHGCVNVRDRRAIEHLFDTVQVGDKVIVYR